MAQIKIVDPAQATGKSKELLTALQNNMLDHVAGALQHYQPYVGSM